MSNSDVLAARHLPRPLRNTYWVEAGRLLAGEYPGGATPADTAERVRALLDAGVTLFVDLTMEGELDEYAALLETTTARRARHFRGAIEDHHVPESIAIMAHIVGVIEQHLRDNGVVYVHCRAGIGRTGTTVACYLARRGLDAEAALDLLNELWLASERSARWPRVPEEHQIEFVERWAQHARNLNATPSPRTSRTLTMLERYEGAMLGLAIGDALGAGVPTKRLHEERGAVDDFSANGPYDSPRGAWLADTAMTLCLADSLLAVGGNDAQDQMQRYLAWRRQGVNSSTGAALAVPEEVARALAQWQWSRKPIMGAHDPKIRDAHPLARTTAVALYFIHDAERALREAAEAARPTLQTPLALDACRVFAAAMIGALRGVDKTALLNFQGSDASDALRRQKLKPEIVAFIDGGWRKALAPRSDQSALGVLQSALWAFAQCARYDDGAIAVINASAAPATAGAVFGALAGAHYGAHAIRHAWRDEIARAATLLQLARQLAQRVE